MSFFPMIGLQDFPNRIKEVTGNPLVELGGEEGDGNWKFCWGELFQQREEKGCRNFTRNNFDPLPTLKNTPEILNID